MFFLLCHNEFVCFWAYNWMAWYHSFGFALALGGDSSAASSHVGGAFIFGTGQRSGGGQILWCVADISMDLDKLWLNCLTWG